MRVFVCTLLVSLSGALAPSVLLAGDPGGRATYVGGTVAQLPSKTQGVIQTTDEDSLRFLTKRGAIQVPWERINLLEYGQKASRRYAMGIVLSPILLLSKKRKHFLTVGYTDEQGRQQAMVFQLNKRRVRAVLASLEAKTGLKVQSQDNEARKGVRD